MTDDVTRGLALLADEADAAPIDADAVIATAMARTRNRAILTTALVTLVVLSALVVTLGAVKPDAPHTADGPTPRHGPPALGTEVQKLATQAEMAERKIRMHDQLTSAFGRILPDGWEHSTFDFDCDQTHCWAQGDLLDEAGVLTTMINVSGDFVLESCFRPSCAKTLLADGTLVALRHSERSDSTTGGDPEVSVTVSAVRPDGTSISLLSYWPASRGTPPLPDDQWRRFGTALTY